MSAAIDYTKLLDKLIPDPGAEDVTRMRTGIVTSANADGTLDVQISGVVIPNISRIDGATAVAGDTVQLISFRGALLALGRITDTSAHPMYRLDTVTRTSNSGNITTTETILDTITVPLVSGRTYQVRAVGGMTVSIAGSGGLLRIRSGTTIGGTQLNYSHPYGPATGNNWGYITEAEFTAGSTGNQSFVATLQRDVGTGNLVAAAGATSPSHLYVNYLRG